ncbi:hypothetical protein COCOBI_04-5090 [Coccomyxa sp. Obi]|nr:hypothetical protein COCOBI_04-5090 [Coccomyxa sp. Obi]
MFEGKEGHLRCYTGPALPSSCDACPATKRVHFIVQKEAQSRCSSIGCSGWTSSALPPAYVPVGTPGASASPPQVQQDQMQGLCEDEAWQASSLKLLQERPFASLFPAELNDTVFDPTGLEQVDKNYYVVFKSSLTIAYIPNRLSPMDDSNKLVAVSSNINKTTFGGIAAKRDDGGFLAVQERRKSDSTGEELRPIIHELQVAPDLKSYTVLRHCAVAFNLSETITGFQDIQIHHDDQGNKWLLGLCNGNHCSGGEYGRDRGNGRIVVSRMKEDGSRCAWLPQKVISIPATAAFSQFSGIAIRRNKMLIASQDDSAIWLGVIDWDSWEFTDQGNVYHLPRNDACQMTYCTINAVQWLDDKRITVASGAAPPGSPWPCFSKAESLHQFLLPSSAVGNAHSVR